MKLNPSILVVDDDEPFRVELVDALQCNGAKAAGASSWEELQEAVSRGEPDVIVLDQLLGRVDAISRLPSFRPETSAIIMMLTGNLSEPDRIIALERGADDFLCKPISARELIARIRARYRRRASDDLASRGWRLEDKQRRLYAPNGKIVDLTGSEFELLAKLARSGGAILSKDELSRAVFLRPWRCGDRSIDNAVYQVRTKIRAAGGGDVIGSVRGRGFYFANFGAPECSLE